MLLDVKNEQLELELEHAKVNLLQYVQSTSQLESLLINASPSQDLRVIVERLQSENNTLVLQKEEINNFYLT